LKMKYIILLILFILVNPSCQMHKIYNNRTDFFYKGQVKEIFTQSYKNDGKHSNPIIGNKSKSSKRIYINKNGRIDSVYTYHKGELGLRTIFENDGKSSCKETIYSNSDGSIQRIITYSYQQENIFEFIVFDAGNRISQKGIKIVENDMTQKESYEYYGETKYTTEYKYDSEGRLLHQIRIKDEIDLIYNINYEYIVLDKSGNWEKRLISHKNEQNKTIFSNFELSEIKYYE